LYHTHHPPQDSEANILAIRAGRWLQNRTLPERS
jgi:hypothetical protein